MGGLTRRFLEKGRNRYVSMDDPDSQGCEFGVIYLEAGEEYSFVTEHEYLFCLCTGSVDFSWDGNTYSAARMDWIAEEPVVLSVPVGTDIRILCSKGKAEINYACTENSRSFEARLICPGNLLSVSIADENRLDGKLKRIKRVFYDWDSHPDSCLFCGEIVNFPGCWACFPPHLHDEPEIYHYRFSPRQGYGFSEFGSEGRKVCDGDTMCIPGGMLHSQATAPGYYGYIMWTQRLKDNGHMIEYRMTEDHKWLEEQQ